MWPYYGQTKRTHLAESPNYLAERLHRSVELYIRHKPCKLVYTTVGIAHLVPVGGRWKGDQGRSIVHSSLNIDVFIRSSNCRRVLMRLARLTNLVVPQIQAWPVEELRQPGLYSFSLGNFLIPSKRKYKRENSSQLHWMIYSRDMLTLSNLDVKQDRPVPAICFEDLIYMLQFRYFSWLPQYNCMLWQTYFFHPFRGHHCEEWSDPRWISPHLRYRAGHHLYSLPKQPLAALSPYIVILLQYIIPYKGGGLNKGQRSI